MATFTLIAHWLACIYYFIAFYERPRLDREIGWLYKLAETINMPYLRNDSHSGPDIRSRYVTSLYFTFTILTSVGFGNVAAVTNAEKIFTIFSMLLGCKSTRPTAAGCCCCCLRLCKQPVKNCQCLPVRPLRLHRYGYCEWCGLCVLCTRCIVRKRLMRS